MNLRKIYYSLSPNMMFLARKLYYFPIDIYETLMGKRDKYEPPKGDIYTGSGDFIRQGKHQFGLMQRHIHIQPSDAVLDIGSGMGRTAVPLTNHLNQQGRYEGFDVVEKGVNWCNSKIKKDFPNFNFLYVPLNNDLYNNHNEEATDFTFPYDDNQFDKAFLFSVFTHMGIDEIQNYMHEIQRVLKPGGLCFATFFIYDVSIEKTIEKIDGFNFPVKKDGYRLMDEDVTAANIAIEENTLRRMISNANLECTVYDPGFWKNNALKRADNDFQDIIVMKKG